MRYLISSILIFIFCFNFVLAQDEDYESRAEYFNLNTAQKEIDEKIVNPMKQGIDYLSEKLENISQNFLEKARVKKEQKEQEIKQEIKDEVKEIAQQKISRFERWVLIPLKNTTQQGSELIKRGVDDIKNFLINLF